MMEGDASIIAEDRMVALERYEHRIAGGFRRGLEAACQIGEGLTRIEEQRLYEERGCQSFSEYLHDQWGFDERSGRRFMKVFRAVEILSRAGLALPENESQAAELGRLDPEELPTFWNKVLSICQAKDVALTTATVRKAVRAVLQTPGTLEAPEKPAAVPQELKINPVLDFSENGEEDEHPSLPASQPSFILSEQGERDLNRIGRLCGSDVSNAILKGNVHLSERDIRKWAEQDDQQVRRLTYYIVDQRWTVTRALNYESKLITEETTIGQLALLARARGGELLVKYQGLLIEVSKQGEE
jgi:hypothetical protein